MRFHEKNKQKCFFCFFKFASKKKFLFARKDKTVNKFCDAKIRQKVLGKKYVHNETQYRFEIKLCKNIRKRNSISRAHRNMKFRFIFCHFSVTKRREILFDSSRHALISLSLSHSLAGLSFVERSINQGLKAKTIQRLHQLKKHIFMMETFGNDK